MNKTLPKHSKMIILMLYLFINFVISVPEELELKVNDSNVEQNKFFFEVPLLVPPMPRQRQIFASHQCPRYPVTLTISTSSYCY